MSADRLITVIPVYNGERYLGATLESVARQSRRPDRVIVQDNCSTDGTRAVFEPYSKLGFEWCPNERHVTSTENFNHALRLAAETDVLHLLTADDLIKPDFYERVAAPFSGVKGQALSYSAYEVIDSKGSLMAGGDLSCPFAVTEKGEAVEISREAFILTQADLRTICLPAVLIKTNRQLLHTSFRMDFIGSADVVFYAEIASRAEMIFEVRAALCQYRRHAEATTSRNLKDPAAVVADEWKAIQSIAPLIGWPSFRKWVWWQRQRCLIAARSKMMAMQNEPDKIQEICDAGRQIAGPIHWGLGNLAVALKKVSRQIRGL